MDKVNCHICGYPIHLNSYIQAFNAIEPHLFSDLADGVCGNCGTDLIKDSEQTELCHFGSYFQARLQVSWCALVLTNKRILAVYVQDPMSPRTNNTFANLIKNHGSNQPGMLIFTLPIGDVCSVGLTRRGINRTLAFRDKEGKSYEFGFNKKNREIWLSALINRGVRSSSG